MPATALPILVGDALVSDINAHAWLMKPEAFEAVRGYDIRYGEDELATVKVTVVVLTDRSENISRGHNTRTLTAWIDIQRKVNDTTATTVDTLVEFANEVFEFCADNHRITESSLSDWYIDDAVYFQDGFWSFPRLVTEGIYEAAIELTLKSNDR